jgi:hypothetical protein
VSVEYCGGGGPLTSREESYCCGARNSEGRSADINREILL